MDRVTPLARKRSTAEPRQAVAPGMVRAILLAVSAASCLHSAAPTPAVTAPPAAVARAAVAPAALAGNWLFETRRGGQAIQYSLHFSVTNEILAGSLTGPDGNARELTRITLQDDKVAWDIESQSGTLHYEGTVSGSSMKGTTKRSSKGRSRGGDSEGGDRTPPEGTGSRSGGMRGGRGGRGGRSASANQQETWSAYKSIAETPER